MKSQFEVIYFYYIIIQFDFFLFSDFIELLNHTSGAYEKIYFVITDTSDPFFYNKC